MKKRLLILLLAITVAFSLNHTVVNAAETDTEEAAEPTDIYTFIDEIEIISPKIRTASTAAE